MDCGRAVLRYGHLTRTLTHSIRKAWCSSSARERGGLLGRRLQDSLHCLVSLGAWSEVGVSPEFVFVVGCTSFSQDAFAPMPMCIQTQVPV